MNKTVQIIAKAGITENTLKASLSARCLVRLDDEPVTDSDIVNHHKLLRTTKGLYAIGYSSRRKVRVGKYAGYEYKPFFIICDLFACPLRVAGPEHFRALANVFPEVAWLIRNTNYSDDLFRIAEEHLGIQIGFSLDFVRYEKMLKEKGATERPFYSTQDYDKLAVGEIMKPGKKEYASEMLLSNQMALAIGK